MSASLAQIGEFSFILAGEGVSLGLLPAAGQSLILAGALISIALNPLVFTAINPALSWLRSRSQFARRLERSDDPLAELPMSTEQAHIAEARMLVVATPQTVEVRQMIKTARTLNPRVEIVVRSHNEEEAALLEGESGEKGVRRRARARAIDDRACD